MLLLHIVKYFTYVRTTAIYHGLLLRLNTTLLYSLLHWNLFYPNVLRMRI